MNDQTDRIELPTCWRCLLEPYPWIGGQGSWMSMALGELPTTCPDCGRWIFSTWRRPWWGGSWAWLPTTLFLLGFYSVPLPAIDTLLADVWAKWQVEAPAPVNPPATTLAAVWTTAGPGGAETVDGGTGRGGMVSGGGQLPAAASIPPPIAGEVGPTAAQPGVPPHQDGDIPGSSLMPVVPTAQPVHATLCGEETPSPKSKKAPKRQKSRGTGVEVSEGVFTDEQVGGLIDDWLVDFLTEGLMRHKWTEGQEG